MSVKKVNLQYKPIAVRKEPAETIPIPNVHLNELSRSIEQRMKQNEIERDLSMEAAAKFIVR